MAVKIHPTAVVSEKAELGVDVEIGPYSVIGDEVRIGDETWIGPHVIIGALTSLGQRNRVHSGAVIGGTSQDLKYRGERSYLRIGNDNIFREYVTVNRATEPEGATIIGNKNAILSYCHIAHDCILGDRITISNLSTLAGHVHVEDMAGIGGYVGIHQFVKIGSLAFLGGWSKVVKDVPPYLRVSGSPLKVYGLNLVGLERNEIPSDSLRALKKAYSYLYRSNHNVSQALDKIRSELPPNPEVKRFVEFVAASSRGICLNNGAGD